VCGAKRAAWRHAVNSLLTKTNLTPLKITPTALSAPASGTFVGTREQLRYHLGWDFE